MERKKIFIYVLKLIENKYYIGRSSKLETRIKNHFNKAGSCWTRRYKPLEIVETMEGDMFDEDKYTLMYMSMHGIENVRGGSFSNIKLKEYEIKTIKKMLNTGLDRCFVCGDKGHYAHRCDKNKTQGMIEFFSTFLFMLST